MTPEQMRAAMENPELAGAERTRSFLSKIL